jgi:hypothetical protein
MLALLHPFLYLRCLWFIFFTDKAATEKMKQEKPKERLIFEKY